MTPSRSRRILTGNNLITDFHIGEDKLAIVGQIGAHDLSDLHFTQISGGTLITLDNSSGQYHARRCEYAGSAAARLDRNRIFADTRSAAARLMSRVVSVFEPAGQ